MDGLSAWPFWLPLLVGTALPLGLLLYKLSTYAMLFPYWDEWHLTLFIDSFYSGRLRIADLWVQHNEHRLFFPRLVMLLLAIPTGWSFWPEHLTSLTLALLTLFLLIQLARVNAEIPYRAYLALPLLTFFVLSWTQMENWVWGFQLQIFLCVLSVVAGVFCIARWPSSWWALAAAAAFGLVAAFSFASGLLYWLILFPMVVGMPEGDRRQRLLRGLIWAGVGVVLFQLYFLGFNKPDVVPAEAAGLLHPVKFLLLYLGNPVAGLFWTPNWHGGERAPIQLLQYLPGVLGSGLFVWIVYATYRDAPDDKMALWWRLAPWLSLAAFACAVGLVIPVGRPGVPLNEALNSRYLTNANLFWCALSVLACRRLPAVFVLRPEGRRGAFDVSHWGVVLIVLLALLPQLRVNAVWEERVVWKRMGFEALRAGHITEMYLRDLCWDPVRLQREFLPILARHKLCGFGDDTRRPQSKDYLEQARLLRARNLLPQARIFCETALWLDQGSTEAQVLHREIGAQMREQKSSPTAPAAAPPQ